MTSKPTRRRPRIRLLVLIATAVLILGVVLYLREYRFSRPVGEGPAGPSVDRERFEGVWTDRKVHVLGIGDSITAGLGARSKRHSYFNRVIENPRDEYADMRGICLSAVLPELSSHNVAISGSESEVHADVIEELEVLSDDVFGIVLMTSGGNDLIHSYGKAKPRECAMYGATLTEAEPWIAKFETRLNAMFDSIEDRFPGGCEIYIGDIYDPTDGRGDAPSIYLPDWPDGLAIHARYNETIRGVASTREKVFVVPLYAAFLGHGSHCRKWWLKTYRREDPFYWFHTNVEDPNDRGYDAIRRVFLNEIVANTQLRS
ncbi:MAG: SGNH/GDSL hydrolase family protein [Planctomycetota bacterium]